MVFDKILFFLLFQDRKQEQECGNEGKRKNQEYGWEGCKQMGRCRKRHEVHQSQGVDGKKEGKKIRDQKEEQ